MVRVKEKRSVSINPTRIDRELLSNLGQIIQTQISEERGISIGIFAESRDIESEDPDELRTIEIPSDTYEIQMGIPDEIVVIKGDFEVFESPIEINMDFLKPKKSRIRVKGEDATWVRGIFERLVEEFEKKKLGYHFVAKYEIARTIMSIIASVLLTYVGGFLLGYFKVESFYIMVFVLVFFYGMTNLLKRFFDWVFPFFEIESGNFLPRKVRKIALVILWGSGIIPILLTWILTLL